MRYQATSWQQEASYCFMQLVQDNSLLVAFLATGLADFTDDNAFAMNHAKLMESRGDSWPGCRFPQLRRAKVTEAGASGCISQDAMGAIAS